MGERAKAKPYVDTVEEGPAYWQLGILRVVLATGEQTGATTHYHDQHFYVIDGQITYLADGEELVAKAGSFVLIPRGTVRSFRVDTETATLLNSYTPAGFERTITELSEPAQARTLPPSDRPYMPAGVDAALALFPEVGMRIVRELDLLREDR